jgi:hypothetical protein
MNVTETLRRLKKPPLAKTLAYLSEQGNSSYIFEDKLSLWLESYSFYYLTLSRLLPEMSLARRVNEAKRIDEGLIQIQSNLAKQYNETSKYLLLDFVNFSLHTRILLDRTIALGQYFISGGNIPSFTSFNNHRKFFLLPENTPYPSHENYAQHIREQTEWFDNLKLIRDKYIVHTQSTHSKWLGFSVNSEKKDIHLTIQLPRGSKENGALSEVKWVQIDVMEIITHVSEFLVFFDSYASTAIDSKIGKTAT